MNYGFIIDNRKCIGCHACSTACKSENEVPLGVNRTWVKYVEAGAYPDVKRHFQVTRCNHCSNPPCVRICPVTAMYQRIDGIVEFDATRCIGCKACMQACPYDAIYIDPDSGTAAKCHYCAHRTEIGLEPACVVVCPEHAIIAGDIGDPQSEIGQLLFEQPVSVRKPEQGTAPKLFYIDGNEVSLHPTATERTPESFLWADVIPFHANADLLSVAEARGHGQSPDDGFATQVLSTGTAITIPSSQELPTSGPIRVGQGRMAEQMVQVAYNAQHLVPWHWPVPAYLVTKGIGSGLFILLGIGFGFDMMAGSRLGALTLGLISLVLVAITTLLLVLDLERPERFHYILLRPQWKSWLTRGALVLLAFTLVAAIWWLLEVGVYFGWVTPALGNVARLFAVWLGIPLALGVAAYTAYLFGQAEGRDLWQSPLLPPHLVVQALMVGSGVALVAVLVPQFSDEFTRLVAFTFALTVIVDLGITLFGEYGMPHGSEYSAQAAHEITHGKYRRHFWLGSIGLGHLLPLLLLLTGWPPAAALAGLCAIAGLWFYETIFVMAPQEIPNS